MREVIPSRQRIVLRDPAKPHLKHTVQQEEGREDGHSSPEPISRCEPENLVWSERQNKDQGRNAVPGGSQGTTLSHEYTLAMSKLMVEVTCNLISKEPTAEK